MTLKGARVYVAGHKGLVGSALCRQMQNLDCEIITKDKTACDLRDASQVQKLFEIEKPQIVLMAAAKVGGIKANRDYPADFLNDNLAIAQNVIHQSYLSNVRKLVFLGSSCIYPRDARQPISEAALLTGSLEPTNEAYAIAKIAGLKLCQFYRRQHGMDFISVMPCNLYGPDDKWNSADAHVIPSLISKFHDAKVKNLSQVVVWGSGKALREFLHVDDAARGILIAAEYYAEEAPVNLGSGHEISIHDLANLVRDIVGFDGNIIFDTAMPDGTPRKVLDNSKINALGFKPALDLRTGLRQTYDAFLQDSPQYEKQQ